MLGPNKQNLKDLHVSKLFLIFFCITVMIVKTISKFNNYFLFKLESRNGLSTMVYNLD